MADKYVVIRTDNNTTRLCFSLNEARELANDFSYSTIYKLEESNRVPKK